jgi:hypothetical protein
VVEAQGAHAAHGVQQRILVQVLFGRAPQAAAGALQEKVKLRVPVLAGIRAIRP